MANAHQPGIAESPGVCARNPASVSSAGGKWSSNNFRVAADAKSAAWRTSSGSRRTTRPLRTNGFNLHVVRSTLRRWSRSRPH
jgi:hypothetical protein